MPPVLRRTLTVNLQRPVNALNGHPLEYEVAVILLASPSSSNADAIC